MKAKKVATSISVFYSIFMGVYIIIVLSLTSGADDGAVATTVLAAIAQVIMVDGVIFILGEIGLGIATLSRNLYSLTSSKQEKMYDSTAYNQYQNQYQNEYQNGYQNTENIENNGQNYTNPYNN